MIDDDKKKTIMNVKRIISVVATSSTTNREGDDYGQKILPAEIILERLNCSELEFVKALKIIKKRFKNVYNRLEIPKCWDGHSHRFYPEAYEDENKIFCEVLSDDLSARMFYDVPIEKDRKWKRGDRVYIPSDNQNTIKCLQEKKLRIID